MPAHFILLLPSYARQDALVPVSLFIAIQFSSLLSDVILALGSPRNILTGNMPADRLGYPKNTLVQIVRRRLILAKRRAHLAWS